MTTLAIRCCRQWAGRREKALVEISRASQHLLRSVSLHFIHICEICGCGAASLIQLYIFFAWPYRPRWGQREQGWAPKAVITPSLPQIHTRMPWGKLCLHDSLKLNKLLLSCSLNCVVCIATEWSRNCGWEICIDGGLVAMTDKCVCVCKYVYRVSWKMWIIFFVHYRGALSLSKLKTVKVCTLWSWVCTGIKYVQLCSLFDIWCLIWSIFILLSSLFEVLFWGFPTLCCQKHLWIYFEICSTCTIYAAKIFVLCGFKSLVMLCELSKLFCTHFWIRSKDGQTSLPGARFLFYLKRASHLFCFFSSWRDSWSCSKFLHCSKTFPSYLWKSQIWVKAELQNSPHPTSGKMLQYCPDVRGP